MNIKIRKSVKVQHFSNCTIICGFIIGKYAFIGAGAVVNKDIKDFALMVGVPAKQIGWMSSKMSEYLYL